jgi:hypothetical protein
MATTSKLGHQSLERSQPVAGMLPAPARSPLVRAAQDGPLGGWSRRQLQLPCRHSSSASRWRWQHVAAGRQARGCCSDPRIIWYHRMHWRLSSMRLHYPQQRPRWSWGDWCLVPGAHPSRGGPACLERRLGMHRLCTSLVLGKAARAPGPHKAAQGLL